MTKTAIIHIGSDKAGSTSIQYFLARNQDALRAQRRRLIRAGLRKAAGHPFLFINLDHPAWAEVSLELTQFESEADVFILSWEGVHNFSIEKLEKLRGYFEGFDVKFVFYIREQGELVQTGLLQRLKQDTLSDVDLFNVASDCPHLFAATRCYDQTIERFESVFGEGCVDLRVFERNQLHKRDVKLDFLQAVGIEDASDFSDLGDVNESLSLEASLAIQLLDPLALDGADRRSLRDAGLVMSMLHKGWKYFLNPEQLARVRAFYAESNQRVARRFFGREQLFEFRDATAPSDVDRMEVASVAAEMLAMWPRYPAPVGKFPAARLLDRRMSPMRGWSKVNIDETQENPDDACGGGAMRLEEPSGELRLMYSPRSIFPDYKKAMLTFILPKGDQRRLRITGVGEKAIEIDCPKERLEFPVGQLGRYGEIAIEIEPIDHDGPLVVRGLAVGFR